MSQVEGSGGVDGVAETLGRGKVRRWENWEKREDGWLTAVRVGHTQSNMSAPRATDTTRSSG